MDKYEEFKKWFANQSDIEWYSRFCGVHYTGDEPFKEFEEEIKEKQKEKEIRRIIINAFNNNCNVYTVTDEIYTELEKEGFLK